MSKKNENTCIDLIFKAFQIITKSGGNKFGISDLDIGVKFVFLHVLTYDKHGIV